MNFSVKIQKAYNIKLYVYLEGENKLVKHVFENL